MSYFFIFLNKDFKYSGNDRNFFFIIFGDIIIFLIDFSYKIRGLGKIDRFFYNYFFL